jgi:hypothetical protein
MDAAEQTTHAGCRGAVDRQRRTDHQIDGIFQIVLPQ